MRARALLILGIMVLGCASHRMTSVIDPAGKGKQYQRLIVLAKVADLDVRRQIEHRVVQRLEGAGAEGVASLDLLPPTREYSESEITTVLWARGIQGFLIFSVNASERDASAPTGTVAVQSELFDVLQQRRAWASMTRTKKNDAPTFATVAPYCDEVVEQMLADKLLARKGRQSPPSPSGDSAER